MGTHTQVGFNTQLETLIEDEVNRRVGTIKQELSTTKSRLTKTQKELHEMIDLNKRAFELEKQLGTINAFKQVFTKDNIAELIQCFGFEESHIPFTGMSIKDAPIWFELMIKYYPDRDKLFQFFDFFEVKYQDWAKDFRMPQDYTKQEVIHIVNNFKKFSIANGCYYDKNMGFFWEAIRWNGKDPKKLMDESSYRTGCVPLQYFFRNPHFADPEVWDAVISFVKKQKKDRYRSSHFFNITRFQKIPDELVSQLMELLLAPKDMSGDEKEFLKRHGNLLPQVPQYARMVANEMTPSSGAFNFLNFPVVMQLEFIDRAGFDFASKVNLIKQMCISREEKLELINKYIHIAV